MDTVVCCSDIKTVFRKDCLRCVALFDSINISNSLYPGTSHILLQLMIEKNKCNLLRHFLSKGLNANTKVRNCSLIYYASDVETLRLLLSSGATVTDQFKHKILQKEHHHDFYEALAPGIFSGFYNKSAMELAIYTRNVSFLNFLMIKGQDINKKDKFGETPLAYAIKRASDNISDKFVTILLDAGAHIHAIDNSGNTMFHQAVKSGSTNMVKFVLSKFTPNIATMIINRKNHHGETALHIAARNGNCSVCAYLLERGALIIRNDAGNTPIDLAERQGQFKLAEYISNKCHIFDIVIE